VEFKKAYEAANGAGSANAFAAYSYDAYLIFAEAAKRAVGKAKPGTPEFRTALRDSILEIRELIGTQGIYNFKAGEAYGVDERSRVLVKVDKSEWQFMP
jgi:branched-chain amino acid transport system substrate-binding protein